MTLRSDPRALILGGALFLSCAAAANAGPCAVQIDAVQMLVDAKADAVAGAGRTGNESTAALLHRQPTPGSIGRAEEALGEGASVEKALAALGRARETDAAGNADACQQALAEALRAIGR
jgi:hypothetical protein